MIYDIIFLLLGLCFLILSGDWLVRGAVGIAFHAGMSATMVGMTIVALGTSAPEFFVTLTAALNGAPDIALGNVIGSNIANILLVLGICSLITQIPGARKRIRWEIIFVAVLTMIFSASLLLFGGIPRWMGLLCLTGQAFFIFRAIQMPDDDHDDPLNDAQPKLIWSIGLTILAIFTLPFSADLLVEHASSLALDLGVTQATIGLSVVAVGTSLPELVASAMAMIRRQTGMALGNIIGSNIFNIGLVIGATAAVSPLYMQNMQVNIDMFFLITATLILGWYGLRSLPMGRRTGLAMLLGYAMFMIFTFRG
ncbi:MAG: calcium/sodium antiporter [Alphaproteobacteria bacterium]